MTTSRSWAIAAIMPLFLVGCSSGANIGGNATLGVTDQNPVVLLQLKTGMSVDLLSVKYDELGRVESYEARVSSGKADRIIKVHQQASAEKGKPAEYVAEADGRVIPTPKGSDGAGAIGFTLKDQGGAVLSYVGTVQLDMKSELGYDTLGRAHVKKQTFTHSGKGYDIEFSGHSYDKNGRLSGYKAQIQKAG